MISDVTIQQIYVNVCYALSVEIIPKRYKFILFIYRTNFLCVVILQSAGRLIPCGIGEWVHVNCALWSAEVYEEQSGMMYDVHSAISRGSRVRCDVCHELGATIGCCACRCSRSFHFLCALSAECVFLANKNLFCPEHSSSCEDQVS